MKRYFLCKRSTWVKYAPEIGPSHGQWIGSEDNFAFCSETISEGTLQQMRAHADFVELPLLYDPAPVGATAGKFHVDHGVVSSDSMLRAARKMMRSHPGFAP